MSVKYRIEYETYSVYQKTRGFGKIPWQMITLFLCVAGVSLLLYLPTSIKLRDLFLPGDPAVTADALRELSNALDNGTSLSSAMDVFCDAIMDVR